MILEKILRLRDNPKIMGQLVDTSNDEAVKSRVLIRKQRLDLDSASGESGPQVVDGRRSGGVGDKNTSKHRST
jgi:hypothetical protein